MKYTDKDRFSKDQRLEVILDSGENYSDWISSGAASSTASGTEHITGSQSVLFHKEPGVSRDALIYKCLDSKNGYDLSSFAADGKLFASLYFPSITDITNLQLGFFMEPNFSDGTAYVVLGSSLSAGWNHLSIDLDTYGGMVGTGVNWSKVKYVYCQVKLSSTPLTLSGILLDNIRVNLPAATSSTGSSITTDAADTARTIATEVLPVQVVDQGGKVPPAGDSVSNSPFVRLTDGTLIGAFATASGIKTTDHVVLLTQPLDESGGVLEGGSGGVGGGAALYSVAQGDFTATYSDSTNLILTGLPFTPTVTNFVEVSKFDSTGLKTTYKIEDNAFAFNSGTGALTVAGANFAGTDQGHDVIMWGVPKSFTLVTDSTRVEEVSPINFSVVEESLVDTTNVAAATNYYPSSDGMVMLGYRALSLTGKFIDADGTMTLGMEVSNDEDATPTNRDWIASSLSAIDMKTGVQVLSSAMTVTSGTLTFGLKYDNLNFKYVRVVMTNNGATNTAIIKSRRIY